MSGPSIRKTAALSAAIHATFFILSLLVLRHSSQLEMPSPYVVTLVGSSGGNSPRAGRSDAEPQAAKDESAPVKRGIVVEKETARNKKDSLAKEAKDRERVADRISELAAMKKLERIDRLRRAIADSKGSGKTVPRAVSRGGAKQYSKGSSGTAGQGGSVMGGYIDKIQAEIHNYWKIPDIFDKKIVAIVDVKILKDGTLFPLGIEKSSGDRHFDNFALATIKSVQRVSPPPPEMDDIVGIRFYP